MTRNESPYQRRTAELQARLAAKEFRLQDIPGYREGQQPDPEVFQKLDHQVFAEQIWGRSVKANGIGKLREVALTAITEHEMNPMYKDDPGMFHQWAVPYESLDIEEMKDQSARYQEVLEQHGVEVHRVEFPDPPVSPFGPMIYMWATRELLIINGGSIIPRMGWSPFSVGRAEYLALWAFQNLSVPPLLTIAGTGVCEAGPCFWLAEDVFVGALSAAFNQEGLDQLYPAVVRSTGLPAEQVHLLTIKSPSPYYTDPGSGASAHPDMVLGPLDVKKVVAYPGGIDYGTWMWLVEHGYEIIEVERDEQIQFAPANVTLLEPGLVIMIAEAKKAVAAVRAAGIEVIDIPYGEFLKAGGGLHCSTMEVWREQGPFMADR